MAKRSKVVVIGAGVAGLTAASKLYQSGQVEVCVLEASERVGGRMHTVTMGETKVEFGASWIHGTVGNPIFDLACNLKVLNKDDINKTWIHQGSRCKPEIVTMPYPYVDNQLLTEVWDVFHKLLSETEDVAKMKSFKENFKQTTCLPKMSVGEYLNHGFQSYLESCLSDKDEVLAMKKNLFRLFKERECINIGCHSLFDVNAEEFGEFNYFEGSDHCPIPGGYDNILKALQTQFDIKCIHFNHAVMQVDWTTNYEEPSQKCHNPVKVLCSNGEAFEADHVILTVSLGVLKENALSLFNPPLPVEKISAIQNLGFGCVGKIVLEFEKPFWSTDEYSIHVIWDEEEFNNHGFNNGLLSKERGIFHDHPWVRCVFGFTTSCPGSNILLAWFHGKEARQIESTSTQEIAQICFAILEKCTSLKSFPPLLSVQVTQWATNPLTQGSYSFLSKGARASDFDCLASPLPPLSSVNKSGLPALQVMFAGEATNRHYYGTVHGAHMTGIREAERLLEYLGGQ